MDQMKYVIKAPGKLVISGEHGVVYGKCAVLTTINLFCTFEVTERKDTVLTIKFKNSAWGPLFIDTSEISTTFLVPCSAHNPKFASSEIMDGMMKLVYGKLPHALDPELKRICFVIFITFVFAFQSHGTITGANMLIYSDIPLSRGLGSSSAFSACLAATVLLWAKFITPENYSHHIALINKWSYLVDTFFHGERHSGMDTTCSMYGGYITFQDRDFAELQLKHDSFRFLIVDTGVHKSTAVGIQNIAALKQKHPVAIDHLFETIDYVSTSIIHLLHDVVDPYQSYLEMKNLLQINQGCLVSLGIDCSASNMIASICLRYGFVNKITGGGNGGVTFVLMLKEDSELENTVMMVHELRNNGFAAYFVETIESGLEITTFNLFGSN